MPGYINYFYKDGLLPSGTKISFNNYSVLTIHGIIAHNTLIFMNKVFNYRYQLPKSVAATIVDYAPSRKFDADHQNCQLWLDNFNTPTYRNSLFFKGPLLYIDPTTDSTITPISCQSIGAFKAQSKRIMLTLQKEGSESDWSTNKFLLHNTNGLRRSDRNLEIN